MPPQTKHMPSKRVWVELSAEGCVIRIFRTRRDAAEAELAFPINHVDRAEAVKDIRRQVFERDGYSCTHCGKAINWDTGHLHERLWRGRGGEMSLDNSTTLCYSCHLNDPVAGHGKRQPQFTRSK